MSDIDAIKERLNLYDVISDIVTLKPSGKGRFFGLCPFHDERSPSFTVMPDKGFYHCFGCKEGGDLFDFVMSTQKVEFVEALEILAQRAGVKIETHDNERSAIKRSIYSINETATEFYVDQLKRHTAARDYLARRGLSDEIIEEFRLGYAPDDWSSIIKSLSGDVKTDDLIQAGLVKTKNDRTYDVFRHRIMFPISDAMGRVSGFSGRALSDDGPKYLNTPETDVFNKSTLLYALHNAKPSIRDTSECIVVEGQMDAIALHQIGFTNTIGVLGSSLTKQHASALQRLDVENLYLAFDSDVAGQKAILAGLDKAIGRQFLVHAVMLPPGSDPADLALGGQRTILTNALRDAISEVRFRFDTALRRHDLSTVQGKKALLNELLPVLKPRDVFDPVAAEMRRLVISELKIDSTRLDDWLNKQRGEEFTDNQVKGLGSYEATSAMERAALDILTLLMSDKELLAERCELTESTIPLNDSVEIMRLFFDAGRETNYNYDALMTVLKEHDASKVIFERLASGSDDLVSSEIDKRLKHSTARLRELILESSARSTDATTRLKEINDKLADPDLPPEQVDACFTELRELQLYVASRDAERQNRLQYDT